MAVFFKRRKNNGDGETSTQGPQAYISPKGDLSYINGLSGLTGSQINEIAFAISNNNEINFNTETIYYEDNTKKIYRKITVGNEINMGDWDMRIIGFNHDILVDSEAYGVPTNSGKAGFTFETVLMPIYSAMNSTGTTGGSWGKCLARTKIIEDTVNYIFVQFLSPIKNVYKFTAEGGAVSKDNVEYTIDKYFILAEKEVYGVISQGKESEGQMQNQYKWYKQNSSILEDEKYICFLRSPKNSSSFVSINSRGEVSYSNAATERDLSVAFCI